MVIIIMNSREYKTSGIADYENSKKEYPKNIFSAASLHTRNTLV